MADYIKRSILCQAYVHIEETEFNDAQMAQFREFLREFILARGRFFFVDEAEADVVTKDGSDIIYATITGGPTAIAVAICKYPEFKAGVTAIASDARRLTSGIISECLFQLRSTQFDAIRIEARTGVFGKLEKLIGMLESIRGSLDTVMPKTVCKRLERLAEHLNLFLYRIDDAGDREFIQDRLGRVARTCLPEKLPPRKKERPSEDDQRLYRSMRREILDLLPESDDPDKWTRIQ